MAMSKNPEKTKSLVTFKKRLEKRIEELNSELKEMQATLEIVNSLILERGFKPAEITKKPSTHKASPSAEEEIAVGSEISSLKQQKESQRVLPLRTRDGELLATFYINGDTLRVKPAEDKSFEISRPPFTQFLVERVLTKMRKRDDEMVASGQLTQERVFSYNIVRNGDLIREIVIRNFNADRLRELRSSIRWTLEKMYEKRAR